MRLGIGEIMKKASVIDNHKERIEFLRKHDHSALRHAFALVYHPSIQWDLGEKWKPDYKPNIYFDQEPNLYQQMRKMGKFMVDGQPPMPVEKKRELFTLLLETVARDDAEFLVGAIGRKMPWKNLGRKVVEEAYPGLLPPLEKDNGQEATREVSEGDQVL